MSHAIRKIREAINDVIDSRNAHERGLTVGRVIGLCDAYLDRDEISVKDFVHLTTLASNIPFIPQARKTDYETLVSNSTRYKRELEKSKLCAPVHPGDGNIADSA